MLYVVREGTGDMMAICNNPTTAENLRAFIDDSIEEVPAAGAAEDYVFTIDGKAVPFLAGGDIAARLYHLAQCFCSKRLIWKVNTIYA